MALEDQRVKGKRQIVHLVCAIQKDETALLRPCTSEASIRYPGIYLHSSIRDRWFLREIRCVRPYRFWTAPEIVRVINMGLLGKVSHHKRFRNSSHKQFLMNFSGITEAFSFFGFPRCLLTDQLKGETARDAKEPPFGFCTLY